MTTPGRDEPLIRVLQDDSRPHLTDPGRPRPVRTYTWEPARPAAADGPVPLAVVSHGTGGSGSEMEWLVDPLREAGFRVVAPDHHGNNFVDGYEPEGFLQIWERPRDISFVLDALDREEPLGPVVVAGFSLGGYTAAALAGARLDPDILWAVLMEQVQLPPVPEFPDLIAALWKKRPLTDSTRQELYEAASADLTDRRVRAIFQVAPGVGALLIPESLAAVGVPVGIRWGGADDIAPYEADTRPYLELIPAATGRSAGPDVRHDDFFNPEPADPDVRHRVGAEAAEFLRDRLA